MDVKQTLGEPRVLISREALLHNARIIRQIVGESTKICAVVKADSYGHSATIAVDTFCQYAIDDLETPAVDALAVACIDEAAALPETYLPVIILRPVENIYLGRQRARLELAIRNGWILTVCSPSAVDDLARVAVSCTRRANVQIMIDTGMSRSGVPISDLQELTQKILATPSLRLFGLSSHFATSETPGDPFAQEQLTRFRSATESAAMQSMLAGKGILRHLANSGGVFCQPSSHFDMVRPGIALYGIDPACQPSQSRKLRPVMKWTAPLIMTRQVKKGEGVGYGQTYHAPQPTRLGLVPVGYADGYMRSFSNRAVMMVHGKPAPVVGRVSMDLTVLDLANIPEARVGDEIIVMDDDPLSPASVYALAQWGQTIPYEIFCRIGSRVHRVPLTPEESPAPTSSSSRQSPL